MLHHNVLKNQAKFWKLKKLLFFKFGQVFNSLLKKYENLDKNLRGSKLDLKKYNGYQTGSQGSQVFLCIYSCLLLKKWAFLLSF